ncbi:hypothetical protein SAMN05216338_103839 [Bradyrhizobium sp. Rc2d]|uniref:hypothetical protein n=1 Tax=Bradyrhizobium sp. Rc2d TaxID=1855321 RepID=UPI0008871445|nr:hypothetical protein [Bradyrhizobium sp. Rc2d]SDJ07016.1 hypothetical protein SAMN05216338_103839 [Bradyrhizobium sp. Rc2d]
MDALIDKATVEVWPIGRLRQKRSYVIADNRLTDASDWDDEMLRLELTDLLEGGFELSLTGITESELSRLSVGVGELEAMPEGERSPYRQRYSPLVLGPIANSRRRKPAPHPEHVASPFFIQAP